MTAALRDRRPDGEAPMESGIGRDLIANPTRTFVTHGSRYLPNGGGRNDAPATAYINRTGGHVVRSDETWTIVQVVKLTDPDWRSPS